MSKASENGTYGNQTEQLRILISQLDQLERENKRLVDQLKKVIRMNSHWQRYDGQREEYVLKLTRTNRELQDKIDDLQREIEDLKKDLKSKKDHHSEVSDLAIGDLKIEDHNTKECRGGVSKRPQDLEMVLLRKEEEIATLTDLVAKLKEKITELENGREARRHQEESEEKVMLLQEQVEVCLEDFKQERKDRERCHDENVRLKERLSQVENDLRAKDEQLFVYQEQIKRLQDRRYTARQSYDEPCCCPDQRPPRRRQHYSQASPVHHQAYYYGDDITELPRDVEIDGEPNGTIGDDGATTEFTSDEINGAMSPHFSRDDDDLCVTMKSTDFRIDDISGAPKDEVFATMKPGDDDETEKLKFNHESVVVDTDTCFEDGDDIDIYGKPKGSQDEPDAALADDEQVKDGIDLNNNNDDDLQCPRCLKSFGVHQHCELLDHVNICMDRD